MLTTKHVECGSILTANTFNDTLFVKSEAKFLNFPIKIIGASVSNLYILMGMYLLFYI
jgi:hypothetical protein